MPLGSVGRGRGRGRALPSRSFSWASSNQFEVLVASLVCVRVEVRSPVNCVECERSTGCEGLEDTAVMVDLRGRLVLRPLSSSSLLDE